MLVIRPVTSDDLDQLVELAALAGFGLTTLPKDREFLRNRIAESEMSFQRMSQRPRGETYLFAMEDLKTGRIVGTSGMNSKVGGFEPFYAYKIETQVLESDVLKLRKEMKCLKLMLEHNGPSEIGSLFLSPEYRRDGNGRLLSLARFLFMAEYPQRFDPMVIAELRGVLDEQGGSPFWNAVGKHFFDVDFPTADYLSMVDKKFIADLMPTHPIYIPLLPADAQQVIGQVHEQTRPARQILEEEGFVFCDMVDIFDAGPVLRCRRDEVRSVKESRRARVAQISDDPVAGPASILCNVGRPLRACKGTVALDGGRGVVINSPVALALGVKVGEQVRYVAARGPRKEGARGGAQEYVESVD